MRDDWRDVVITRGRTGAGWKKRGRLLPLEDRPRCEPMGRRGTKHFGDHLGPLKRLLTSREGRPWDEVWSELCRALDRRGYLQQHVFQHVLGWVAVHVVEVDGELWRCDERGRRRLSSGRWRTSWYVDPHTRRLTRAP